MNQKNFSNWLKIIIICVGLIGLLVYFFVLPYVGRSIVHDNNELAYCFWPWQVFLWLTGIPYYVVLVYGWKIVVSIGSDNSFSYENADRLKKITYFAAGDTGFFTVVNIIFLFLSMSHPGIVLMSMVITFIGIVIAVVSAALSHLVINAANLQQQSDLTI